MFNAVNLLILFTTVALSMTAAVLPLWIALDYLEGKSACAGQAKQPKTKRRTGLTKTPLLTNKA